MKNKEGSIKSENRFKIEIKNTLIQLDIKIISQYI